MVTFCFSNSFTKLYTYIDPKNSIMKLLISNANLAQKISDNLIRRNTTWELIDQFSKNQELSFPQDRSEFIACPV